MDGYNIGGINMKPRIFVSSTFYDLKYIREDLSNFIKSYNFEPIMFEDGDIGYTPGKPLDSSCYEAMRGADMVVLIIGGQYGSAATGEDSAFNNYMSVTRREFQTAVENAIPIFAFIDSGVYCEYDVYNANCNAIEQDGAKINFAIAKNANVFRFIREVKTVGNIVITPFDKSNVIKEFLSKQWSDMFKMYLTGLKQQSQIATLQSTVKEMQNFMERMNVMLDSLGRKVLGNESNIQYSDIIATQTRLELESIADEIALGLTFGMTAESVENRRVFVSEVLDVLNQVEMNYSDIIDTPQDGISSQVSKRVTIEITKLLVHNKKPIRLTNVNLVNAIPSLKGHLKLEENREYLIELLIQDNLFYRMFEQYGSSAISSTAYITKAKQ